jgi:hypothetical protein
MVLVVIPKSKLFSEFFMLARTDFENSSVDDEKERDTQICAN